MRYRLVSSLGRGTGLRPVPEGSLALWRAISRAQDLAHGYGPSRLMALGLRRRYPSPRYFIESDRQALRRVGVSRSDAFFYTMIPALTRASLSGSWGEEPLLDSLRRAEEYLRTLYIGVHVECFYALLLDSQGLLIRPVLLQRGGPDSAPFYLRRLLDAALREDARLLVLAHNHPGGTLSPSAEDLRCTLRALEALTPLGMALLDHVIVAGEVTVSIRAEGLLPDLLWTAARPDNAVVAGWLDP